VRFDKANGSWDVKWRDPDSGKLRRKRRSDAGRTNHWKKAIVRLKEGESLDLI
jgi:hypothetical protein